MTTPLDSPSPTLIINDDSGYMSASAIAFCMARMHRQAPEMSGQAQSLVGYWADALDSGLYKKASEYLYDAQEGAYCALGVYARACVGLSNKALKYEADITDLNISLPFPNADVIARLNDESDLGFHELAMVLRWAADLRTQLVVYVKQQGQEEERYASAQEFIDHYFPIGRVQ